MPDSRWLQRFLDEVETTILVLKTYKSTLDPADDGCSIIESSISDLEKLLHEQPKREYTHEHVLRAIGLLLHLFH